MTYIELLRDTNKFNTVLAVILVIFLVLVLYLFRLDRKITKLEKNKQD